MVGQPHDTGTGHPQTPRDDPPPTDDAAQAGAEDPSPARPEPGRFGAGPAPHATHTRIQPAPDLPGKEREYLLGILLTVLTFGIYHFYYHYRTHDELGKALGRDYDSNPIFIAYLLVVVVGGAALGVMAPIVLVPAFILFAILVVRQYAWIAEARVRLGLPPRGDAVWFLIWASIGSLILVGPFIAYYNLVHNYNDIWRTMRHGTPLAPDRAFDPRPGPQAAPGVAAADPTHPAPHDTTQPSHATRDFGSPAATPAPGSAATAAPAAPAAPGTSAVPGGPGGFDLRGRHAPPAPPPGEVEQRFRCPRCDTEVAVTGRPGASVPVACGMCGETGAVTIES